MAYFKVDNITTSTFKLTLAELQHPFTTAYYTCFYLKIDGEIASMTPAYDFDMDTRTITCPYDFSNNEYIVSGGSYDVSVTVVMVDGNHWDVSTGDGALCQTITIPTENRPDKAVYDFCKVVKVGNKSLKAYVDFTALDTAGYLLDSVYVDTELTPDVGRWELTRSSPEAYFYNLSDGMTYIFGLYAYYDGNLPIDNSVEIWEEVKRKISLFNWTDDERNALENRGEITAITNTRWNTLCEYARQTLIYWGIGEDAIGVNNYGIDTYAELQWAIKYRTQIAASDKKLYAKKFNILNHCICKEIYTGIEDRVGMTDVENGNADKADRVLGEYFIKLVDCLNYK